MWSQSVGWATITLSILRRTARSTIESMRKSKKASIESVAVIIKMNINLINTSLEYEIEHTTNPPLPIVYLPPNVESD